MNDFITDVKYLWTAPRTDRRGVTAVEYGIMAALISLALVSSVGFLTGGLTRAFTRVDGLMT